MNKKDNTYRMPEGFNPYASLDSIRGLSDAIHNFMLEGPGTNARIPYGDKAGVNALIELLQAEAQAVHEYFAELKNRTSLDLPLSQDELDALDFRISKDEVKEEHALYLVQRH